MTSERAEHRSVGKRETRIEGPGKVTGLTQYTGDVQLPNMLHCKLVLSPHAHARIGSIDGSAALAIDGVTHVVTAEDLDRGTKDGSNPSIDASNRGDALLAYREAVFAGQPVAAVLAETPWAAEEGAEAVVVSYQELPAVVDVEAAMQPDSPLARAPVTDVDRSEEAAHVTIDVAEEESEGKPTNIASHVSFSRGDVAQGFAEADIVYERTWRSATMHQGYIEPQSNVAAYEPVTGELTVWSATQGQFHVRDTVMRILKWPETHLRVIAPELGGGFGAKMATSPPLVSALAVIAGQPVKLVFTRHEDILAATPAPGAVTKLKTGMKSDGTLTAFEGSIAYEAGAFPGAPAATGALLMSSFYRWPHLKVDGYEVLTNKVSAGAIRAPGVHNAMQSIEQHIDEMARQAGLDPAEVRAKNAVRTGDPMSSGKAFTAIGFEETIEAARQHPLWQNREQAAARASASTKRRGVGLAVGGWLGGLQPAAAELLLNTDGTLNALTGAVDISGTATSFAQIVSEELNLPLEKISISTGDTKTAPFAGMSAGSKTLFTVGRALREAAVDLREQMFAVAAERLEANPADLETEDGAAAGGDHDGLRCALQAARGQGDDHRAQPGARLRRPDRRSRGGHRDRFRGTQGLRVGPGCRLRREPDVRRGPDRRRQRPGHGHRAVGGVHLR
jgi:CO/xanthine dehydrogenase Mo-binding subunit